MQEYFKSLISENLQILSTNAPETLSCLDFSDVLDLNGDHLEIILKNKNVKSLILRNCKNLRFFPFKNKKKINWAILLEKIQYLDIRGCYLNNAENFLNSVINSMKINTTLLVSKSMFEKSETFFRWGLSDYNRQNSGRNFDTVEFYKIHFYKVLEEKEMNIIFE